jgi:NitT/TauT family transport system permease protein
VRLGTILLVLGGWELLANSGLLYENVVPSLARIIDGAARILVNPAFYPNMQVTALEVVVGVLIGTVSGTLLGLILGGNRIAGQIVEPLVYYLGPTPKIIFLPVLVMCFGLGPGSKLAIGAIASFFPVCLSVAVGMREIDAILVRVGRSFRASPIQMSAKIYLPAMREPLINGIRLGFGVSIITILLAETKLSSQGLGFMVMRYYQQFDMPAMYGLVVIIFILSLGVNALLGNLSAKRARWVPPKAAPKG